MSSAREQLTNWDDLGKPKYRSDADELWMGMDIMLYGAAFTQTTSEGIRWIDRKEVFKKE